MSSDDAIELVDHKIEEAVEHIWSVFQDSYKAEADLLGAAYFPPLKRSMKNIQKSNSTFWGYRKRGQLVGVVEIDNHEKHLSICSLAVRPPFFRRGIATALVRHVLQMKENKDVVVHTATLNAPAIFLYRKFGFSEQESWDSPEGIVLVTLVKKGSG